MRGQLASSGWNIPARGDGGRINPVPTPAPVAPRPTTPTTVQGPKGDKGDPGEPGKDGKDADEQAILLALFAKIKSDPQFRGDKGDPGEFDPAKMQFALQFTDKTGQVVEEVPFSLDKSGRMVAQIRPLRVETYDSSGKLTDADEYPIPWGIKLKPIVLDKAGNPVGQRGT